MKCKPCQALNADNKPCGALTSCKVGCVKYCFIHAARHSRGKCIDELDEILGLVGEQAEKIRQEAEDAVEARNRTFFDKLGAQLENTKKNLETIVAERTRQLNAIRQMIFGA